MLGRLIKILNLRSDTANLIFADDKKQKTNKPFYPQCVESQTTSQLNFYVSVPFTKCTQKLFKVCIYYFAKVLEKKKKKEKDSVCSLEFYSFVQSVCVMYMLSV